MTSTSTRVPVLLLLLTLPPPSFSTKARSLSSSEPTRRPLQPCIVHRLPDSPIVPRFTRHDLPTLSSSPPRTSRDGVETVPLRPCCMGCVASIEQCMLKGAEWKEKFTAGARRRRNSACNNSNRSSGRSRLHDYMPGFEAVVSVDEVAKKQSEKGGGCAASPEDASDAEERHPGLSLRRKNLNMDNSDLLSSLTLTESISSLVVNNDEFSSSLLRSEQPSTGLADSAIPPATEEDQAKDRPQGLVRSDSSSSSSIAPSSPEGPLHRADLLGSTMPATSRPCAPLSEAYSPDAIPEELLSSMNLEQGSTGSKKPNGPTFTRKRSFVHLPAPGSFFKASTEMFRGVGAGVFGGGVPMSV